MQYLKFKNKKKKYIVLKLYFKIKFVLNLKKKIQNVKG